MQELESTTFVAKLAKMDSQAWRTLCCEYARTLLSYAKTRFDCSPDRGEEIAQRTFVRSVRSIQQFDRARRFFRNV